MLLHPCPISEILPRHSTVSYSTLASPAMSPWVSNTAGVTQLEPAYEDGPPGPA